MIPRPTWLNAHYAAVGAGFLVLYVLVDLATLGLRHAPGIAIFHAPSGVAFAALIGLGLRYLPWYVLALVVVSIYDRPWGLQASLMMGALSAAGLAGAAYLARSALGLDRSLARITDASSLLAAALLAPAPAALYAAHVLSVVAPANWSEYAVQLYLSELVAILVLAPVLLFHALDWLRGLPPRAGQAVTRRELTLQALAVLATIVVVFVLEVGQTHGYYLAFLPLIWVATRGGVGRTATTLLTLVLGAIAVMKLTGDSSDRVIEQQLLFTALAVTGLGLGVARSAASDAAQRLAEVTERNQRLLQTARIMPWEADMQTWRFTFVGDQAEELFGYPTQRWMEKDFWEDRIHPEDRAWVVPYCSGHAQAGQDYELEYRMRAADGRYIWVHDVISIRKGHAGYVMQGFLTDITERKELEEELVRHTLKDRLTGLPNRALMMARLEVAISRQWPCALMVIDLDRFKDVNDSLGHDIGDELLREIVSRLAECLPERATLARLGGDELAVSLERDAGAVRAQALAEAFHEALRRPFPIAGRNLSITASIGLADAEAGATDAKTLLRDAEIAMYRAKGEGGARTQRFEAHMHSALLDSIEMEEALRRALAEGGLQVYYQPILRLEDGTLCAFEALVRWNHPELGVLSPDDFLPVARTAGLLPEIDRYVLEFAVAHLVAWREELPGLEVNVNMSADSLGDPHLVTRVRDLLQVNGIPPGAVQLEITETDLVASDEASRERLHALRELGVGLQVDDFGTGYSSLSYIDQFPVNSLKIDRSFVTAIAYEKNREIIRAIIQLARRLRLGLTAEGVETAEHRDLLSELGCPRAQGFLFSRPVDQAGAERLVREALAA